ncbi:MAG: nucleotidyltransferase domain-containing protein [Acidobacteria bacterium]|jgi:predicted nucleotidyltransferase|nr:nucleotidyltransferase domain-containing protein [Acidobacteriota bacterium]
MRPLKSINDKYLLSVLADVKEEARKIFGDRLKQLILFGSYARQEQDNESDIDIMLLVDETEEKLRNSRDAVADIMAELSMKHEKLISLIEVPFNRYKRYLEVLPFYKNVYDEGIEIYGRDAA